MERLYLVNKAHTWNDGEPLLNKTAQNILVTISLSSPQNRQCQGLGVRGIGVGADSPLPPMHSVEATLPLTTQPLHYAASTPDVVDVTQEFKSLPGKLSSMAAPILATTVSWFSSVGLLQKKWLTKGSWPFLLLLVTIFCWEFCQIYSSAPPKPISRLCQNFAFLNSSQAFCHLDKNIS